MTYAVEIKRSARKTLLALPHQVRQRIRTAIDELGSEPRPDGSRKLVGSDNLYRRRVGDYRIIYEVHDDRLVVLVIKLGHRREVYR